MKDLIIVGSGGHCRTVLDIALEQKHIVKGVIDLNFDGKEEEILGVPVIGGMDFLNHLDLKNFNIHLAIGDNQIRYEIFKSLNCSILNLITLIHKSSVVSKSAQIGSGCLIAAGSVINPLAKVGMCTIVNTKAAIDHESQIGDFSHIGPNSTIAGRVKIGEHTFLGVGSNVADKVTVESSCVIGAGSIITKDVAKNTTVVGFNRIIS